MSRKKSYMSRDKKQKLLYSLFGGLFVVGAILLLISLWQKHLYKEDNNTDTQKGVIKESTTLADKEVGNVVYKPKGKVISYLFMGIDKNGKAVKAESYGQAGQADSQFLLVVDDEAKTWQILQLNRDSYVEVPVKDMFGIDGGMVKEQLALAYSYGDGLTSSAKNAVRAVSHMLGDVPISHYLAMNMDAVGPLVDCLGGVELTMTADYTMVDERLTLGKTVTLDGDLATRYVRARKDVDDQTNLARMSRQRQFLAALEEKLDGVGESKVLECYDAITDYMVTDMGSQNMVDLVEKMKSYKHLENITIDGENSVDSQGFICYNLAVNSLEQTILQLFYKAE